MNAPQLGKGKQDLADNGPPAPTARDIRIAQHNGTTMALDVLPERLQASKNLPLPTLTQRIEQLTRENELLRLEITYYRRLEGAAYSLHSAVNTIRDKFQQARENYEAARTVADKEWVTHSEIVTSSRV
ncbi:MAG: hypothetical protein M1816_005068 [Peltula sp. TS41687]|nr:MAG: hypothetical protein M1816_005068 [Peltula sp. TS41687]